MKVSRKLRQVFCGTIIAASLLGTSIISYAETINFTLTVTRNGCNEDNISKRATKADTEQRCYVTATSVPREGTVMVKSIKLFNSNIESREIIIDNSEKDNVKKASYNGYAASGTYYYLQGRFGRSNTSSVLNIKGRYTP